jgi:glycyl-tRNA synthetase beta subunit
VRAHHPGQKTFTVDPKTLSEEEKACSRSADRRSRLGRGRDPDSLFGAFLPMIPAVNEFFDKVLVMDEKKARRENRLGLLQRVAALAAGIADLSKLEGF